jgi:hypothetical protein
MPSGIILITPYLMIRGMAPKLKAKVKKSLVCGLLLWLVYGGEKHLNPWVLRV